MAPRRAKQNEDAAPNANDRLPLAVRVQFEAARRLGWPAEVLDPEYGYLFEIRHPRRTAVLYAGRSPLNDSVAARITEDKFYTELVLRRAGYRVVHSARCLSPRDFRAPAWQGRGGLEPGVDLAQSFGFPVVVKPNRLSHGYGVRLVRDEPDLRAAVEEVWDYDYCALVQGRVAGLDLRLNFLDGAYLMGYARAPLTITCDGRASLRQLLIRADARYADDGFWAKARRDPIWRQKVVERDWSEDTVLPRDTQLRFESDILNLNRWAAARLVPEISEAWRVFGVHIGQALGLRHFGIDCKVPAIDAPPDAATIIEVNSSPLLTQLYRMGWQEEVIAAQTKVLNAYFAK